MNHYERLEYIRDWLERANPTEVEALYWLIETEF